MTEILSYESDSELLSGVADRLVQLLSDRDSNRPFRLVLTGGTLGIALLRLLQERAVEPADVDIFWGDERWVNFGHADRNENQALEAWPLLLTANLHRFESPESTTLSSAATAMNLEYEALISADPSFGFDLTLLGVGPDGHVASLFPGHSLDQNRWVIYETDSPKPPPERISFSYDALNASKRVWFLASGQSKARAVTDGIMLGRDSGLPCGNVTGSVETVWFIDREIAALL